MPKMTEVIYYDYTLNEIAKALGLPNVVIVLQVGNLVRCAVNVKGKIP